MPRELAPHSMAAVCCHGRQTAHLAQVSAAMGAADAADGATLRVEQRWGLSAAMGAAQVPRLHRHPSGPLIRKSKLGLSACRVQQCVNVCEIILAHKQCASSLAS